MIIFVFLATLAASALGLTWTPSDKPSILNLDIDNSLGNQSFTEHLSLHLTSAPILRYRRIDFRRQIMQAYRILDQTALSLLGNHIKIHENRFQRLTHLHNNDNFLTRKDMDHEFLIKDHLQYHTCQVYCINHKATMINTLSSLNDIQRFTPRFPGKTWLKSAQSVALSDYNSKYKIQFDNISLTNNFKALGFNKVEIFHINGNRVLEKIDFSEIGVSTNYWSSIKNGQFYQKIPLHLLTAFDQISNKIQIFVPLATHSLIPETYYGRCVCQRSLVNNDVNLEKARNIIKSSLKFRFDTPQNIEFLRLKSNAPATASSIYSLLKNNKTAAVTKLIQRSDIHPLLLDPPSNQPCEDGSCIQQDEPMSHSTYALLQSLFTNPSLLHNTSTTLQRQERAALTSLGTSIFFKAITISSPYLWQTASEPFKKLIAEFKDSRRIQPTPSLQFHNTSELNDYLEQKFMNTPLKLKHLNDKFEITIRHKFPTLKQYTRENIQFAEDIKRASETLGFYKSLLEEDIPKLIINSIIATSEFPISPNPVLFDLYHSASFIVFRAFFEIIKLNEPYESIRLISMPHKMLGHELYHYQTNNYSLDGTQLSSTTSISDSKCFNSMSSSTPTPLISCKQDKKPSRILETLIKLKSATLFQIQGPSTIKITCLGHLSDTLKLAHDLNLIVISNSCDLVLNHNSLIKLLDRTSQQLSSFKFRLLLQYQLPQYNSFQEKIMFFLNILATTLSVMILILCILAVAAMYLKHKFKPQFIEDNLTIAMDTKKMNHSNSMESLHQLVTLDHLPESSNGSKVA